MRHAQPEWTQRGAFNLITWYGNAGETGAARALYDDLAALARAHPDEHSIREKQARGAFSLIYFSNQAGDAEAARRRIKEDMAADPALQAVIETLLANMAYQVSDAGS